MFKTYSSSSSLVITSYWFATSRLRVPVFVRRVYSILHNSTYSTAIARVESVNEELRQKDEQTDGQIDVRKDRTFLCKDGQDIPM